MTRRIPAGLDPDYAPTDWELAHDGCRCHSGHDGTPDLTPEQAAAATTEWLARLDETRKGVA